MKKKNKNLIFNLIMAAAVFAVIISGVFIVGNIKGWFGDDSSFVFAAENVKGIVRIERSGISYSLEEGASIRKGDIIDTDTSSRAVLNVSDRLRIYMDENTGIVIGSIPADKGEKAEINVISGQIFVENALGEDYQVATGSEGVIVTSRNAVYAHSAYSASVNVMVFDGDVNAASAKNDCVVSSSQKASFFITEDSSFESEISQLNESSLDGFILGTAMETSRNICFDKASLEKITENRAAEKLALQERSEITDGEEGKHKLYCTVTVRCDTILNNLSGLADGKESYVPKDGMVLGSTKVYFYDGETAFDVLKRVCEAMDIQLEYSWTPIYNSHYVEGINHLYEFDCGPESGWMYKADGWFPNYGASAYKLKDGDNIIWAYTCKGLGEDVGGSIH